MCKKYSSYYNEEVLEQYQLYSILFKYVLKIYTPRTLLQLHQQGKLNELPFLDAEVLQVHAPPFVSKETNSSQAIGPAFSRVQRRRSFIKKVCIIIIKQ